jgi:uncharacterized protein (TIGR02246 family)
VEVLLKPFTFIAVSFAVLLTSSPLAFSAIASPDDLAIQGIVEAWETDWNSHDMDAMGTLVTEDADFVNVAGLHWKGRAQIVREHAERHRTNLKLSHWTTRSVTIQQLWSKAALVHINWGITGDTDFDGTPREARDGIFSWLMMKQNGHWLIRSAQNTNVSPRK